MWSQFCEEANEMEKNIYNDDVERIVNDPERKSAIKKRNEKRRIWKYKKMLVKAVALAGIGLIFGLFGCFGWISPFISIIICAFSGFYAAFLFGRWFENGKCNGWK